MGFNKKQLEAHQKRLQALQSPMVVKEIEKGLFAGGQVIEAYAKRLITEGSVSGKGHVASKPGAPPNYDTGVLTSNIETTKAGVLTVHVSSKAPYAGYLEFGTSRMAERPYMLPARNAKEKEVAELVIEAVNFAVRKSKRTA